jgi:hypothetical protein
MKFTSKLFSPSGGVTYHLAALLFSKTLWSPFLVHVRSWLENDWHPEEREILIFGSSAGWTLPASFLARFDRIVAVDPDPLAKWLFQKRFSTAFNEKQVWLNTSAPLRAWSEQNSIEPMQAILSEYPNACILFSNVLGQVPLESKSRSHGSSSLFLKALQTRTWASYHDLYSSAQSPKSHSTEPEILSFLTRVFTSIAEVIDHETQWLGAKNFTLWRLSPKQTQVVGFVSHKRKESAGANPSAN